MVPRPGPVGIGRTNRATYHVHNTYSNNSGRRLAGLLLKAKDVMLEFPVKATQSENGGYVAILVDLPEGPIGRGVDPYAAVNDLSDQAQTSLAALLKDGSLPEPSPVDDRPVVQFDETGRTASMGSLPVDSPFNRFQQSTMLCYSWTNDVFFPDS